MSSLIIGSGTIQLGEKNWEHSYKCVKIFNVKKQKKTETDSSLLPTGRTRGNRAQS